MTDSTPSTSTAEAPARPRRKSARRTAAGARKKTARKKTRPAAGTLEAMLGQLAARATKAGSAIAAGAAGGTASARQALGRAKRASRSAIRASIREWKKLDTPRKVEFVATLLSALAAASGTIASAAKEAQLFQAAPGAALSVGAGDEGRN
jgi:hypothetical protein